MPSLCINIYKILFVAF